jgi:4-hydroxy-tetrahydrodipicolinate synthase
MPRESARLFELVADENDRDQALALYRRILPIVRWVGGHRYVSATKAAFEMMGLHAGPPRPPRLPLPEDERAELDRVVEALGLKGALAPAPAA